MFTSKIGQVVKIVNDYQEAEGIMETNAILSKRITETYNHYKDLYTARQIAAIVLMGGTNLSLDKEEVLVYEQFFFPDNDERMPVPKGLMASEEALFDEDEDC